MKEHLVHKALVTCTGVSGLEPGHFMCLKVTLQNVLGERTLWRPCIILGVEDACSLHACDFHSIIYNWRLRGLRGGNGKLQRLN